MRARGTGVWVIIPYYQKETGLLLRSIKSALGQTAPPEGIIVVDDGSPVPAATELAALSPVEAARITLIRQVNRGPGAARNTALSRLPEDARRIAFLDSDDSWDPHYLASAHDLLDRGFDAVLTNWTTFQSEDDGYTRWGHFDALDLDALKGFPDRYDGGGQLVEMQIRSPLGRLSALVAERSALAGIYFDDELRYACEDRKFVLEMAYGGARFAIDARPLCHAGRGYNLFSSVRWGSPKSLLVQLDRIKFCRDVARLELSPRERGALRELQRRTRRALVQNWVSTMKRHGPELGTVGRLMRIDPAALLMAPDAFASALRQGRA